ncbi:MAG: hypothetical protein OXH00_02685 [Candidatus Poribacteria bacterium]|nr:hypothetical protein [Candidatus Poribacteria bacterium]
MVEIAGYQVIKKPEFTGKILKAVFVSVSELRVKADFGGNVEVYGFDFSKYIKPIDYRTDAVDALISAIRPEGTHTVCEFEWDACVIRLKALPDIPNYFCLADGETETLDDMGVDVEYFAPGAETGVQFYDRLMPSLHEAAKSYLDQHIPTAEIAGNSRGVHATTRSSASKIHADTTANAFRLPIGFAARQLDCHRQGKGHILSRTDTEKLVKDIHEVFTKDDAWWEHHYGHDVRYWNKYHNARQVLLTTPDGTVESIYDIDANIRKNLPKTDRDNTELITQQGEAEFHSLATDYFTKALYGPRDPVTKRTLTFKEKT